MLEGSVRRAGDRVRITTQLIQAKEDEHLWAENYERELSDTFAVQADVARQVAAALKATLTPSEVQQIEAEPTANLEAYEYYLRARVESDFDAAAGLLQKAVELDPNFAAAWASLAGRWIRSSFERMDSDLRERGIGALERAGDLAPDAFETLVAQAEYDWLVPQNLDQALEHLRMAERLRPNDANVLATKGEVLLFTGQWDEVLTTFVKAADLDPLNGRVAILLASIHRQRGDFPEAERYFDRSIALDPSNQRSLDAKFDFLLYFLGDTTRAREFADQHPERSARWLALLDYVRRDHRKALESFHSEPMFETWAIVKQIHHALNEPDRLRTLSDSLRVEFEKGLDQAIAAQAAPTVIAYWHAWLGQQYASLGEREAAIRQAEKALATYRVSADALNYGGLLHLLARLYIWMGENDQAIGLLEEMLADPSSRVTAAWLRLDPLYDPLRDEARFRELLDRYE